MSGTANRYVVITGGVVSGLGKGIVAASVGRLLKARGISVGHLKLDPYLNVDPGTMNPGEHGEVYVTTDGAETDLDLGHYERFSGAELGRGSSVTAGQIWQAVLERERQGGYLGQTVQVVPHITDEMKSRLAAAGDGLAGCGEGEEDVSGVVIVEVGGTVGDIEGEAFLEALRQWRRELEAGDGAFVHIHVSWVPYIAASEEFKSKPTQHSVAELRSRGLHPDVVVLRSENPVGAEVRRKVAMFCDVAERAVIGCADADDIYEVPLLLEAEGLGEVVAEGLRVEANPELAVWEEMVDRRRAVRESGERIRVGIVGKYVERRDAYLSVCEALGAAGAVAGVGVEEVWVAAETLEATDEEGKVCIDEEAVRVALGEVDAVLVPGGFGLRGVEGKIGAVAYARENKVPFLGLCLGLQCAVIEAARGIAGLEGAHSAEFGVELGREVETAVIDLMESQVEVEEMGGTQRLGSYDAQLTEGSLAAELYGTELVRERHRHRYEVNNAYREALEEAGLRVSGTSPDGTLVEFVEREDHPFFIATQAHPEFTSRPEQAHPLFRGLIEAAKTRAMARPGESEQSAQVA